MLAEDYILKQLTASLIYPESRLGKDFWDRVYEKARREYGVNQIPFHSFNKVWIVADKAQVYEHGQTALVVGRHLRVMLEEDYLALQKHVINNKALGVTMGSEIMRQLILPEIEKEVNTGKNFAQLRQIFNSVILSTWYKRRLKEALLSQVYADKSRVKGIEMKDPRVKEEIYELYLKAYKKGVFNYIKEDIDPVTQKELPRKYFSGGTVVALGPAFGITQSPLDAAMGIEAEGVMSDRCFSLSTALGINAPADFAMGAKFEHSQKWFNTHYKTQKFNHNAFLIGARMIAFAALIAVLAIPFVSLYRQFKANEEKHQLDERIEQYQYRTLPASAVDLPQGTNVADVVRATGVDTNALVKANPTVNLSHIRPNDRLLLPGVSSLVFLAPTNGDIPQLAKELNDPNLLNRLWVYSTNLLGQYSITHNHFTRGQKLSIVGPKPEIDGVQNFMGLKNVTVVQGPEIPGTQWIVGTNKAGPIYFKSAEKGDHPRDTVLFTPEGPADNPYGFYVHEAKRQYLDFLSPLETQSEIVGEAAGGKAILVFRNKGNDKEFMTMPVPGEKTWETMYLQVDRKVEQLGVGLDHVSPIQLWTYPSGDIELVAKSLGNAPLSTVYNVEAISLNDYKRSLLQGEHHETILGGSSSHKGSIRLMDVSDKEGKVTQYIEIIINSGKGKTKGRVWKVLESKVSIEIPDLLDHSSTAVPLKSQDPEKQVNTQASTDPSAYGGIDVNMTSGLTEWHITRDGQGLELSVKPGLIARIENQGIQSLYATVFKITPVNIRQYLEGF